MYRRFGMLCAAIAAAIAMVLPVTEGMSGATTSTVSLLATPSNVMRRFSPQYMMGAVNFTQTEAVNIAKAYDVIVALPATFAPWMAPMKAANPKLVVLAYENATFAQETQATAYPSTWYARNAAGNKVRSTAYGNYFMGPSSTGWANDRTVTCGQFMATSGYDGCFLDMRGTGL